MIESLSKELLAYKGKSIGVISHVRPDADCIGSQVALCVWLQKIGVKPQAFNDDAPGQNISWMNEIFPVQRTNYQSMKSLDAFIFVDGNHPSRFGRAGEISTKLNTPIYLIDHHPQPADIYKISVSDVETSSTAELVYCLFKTTPGLMDIHVAKALYAGIMTDTGSFRFDSVSWRTHAAVAEMMQETGLQTEPIHRMIYDGRELKHMLLLARVLSSIRLHNNGKFASMVVTRKLLEETGTSYHDLEGMVNYGLSIKGVLASVLFCELDNRIKLSLRSASDVDVNLWARNFNGGGHVKAAGGWFDGTMEDALVQVFDTGAKQL